MPRALPAAVLLALLPAAAFASPVDDDFSDGVAGPQWQTYTQDPAHLSLAEQNGALNVVSTAGGTSRIDALYLSTFALSTASNFSLTLTYNLSNSVSSQGSAGDRVGLDFGVGTDAGGANSAAIGVGYANQAVGPISVFADAGTIASRTNNGPDTALAGPTLAPSSGTLEIDYDAAADRLTFGVVGDPALTASLTGTVHGVWNAGNLLVSFGGRVSTTNAANGIAAGVGSITMDNFAVASGTITPEPAALAGLGLGAMLLRRRPRGR